MRLSPKHPGEKKLVRFPFKTEVSTGLTVVSVAVQIATTLGTDATPGNVLDGAALIDPLTLDVLQVVKAGTLDCDYELLCFATDSSGLVHLIPATLPIRLIH